MKKLTIKTSKRREVVDITDIVNNLLWKTGAKGGLCNVFVIHTTCALATADLDPGTDLDFLDLLEKIVPDINFRHPHDPSHTPSHLLSSIIGPSVTVPVKDGKLVLGTWQRIVLVELDGPREREVIISMIGDEK